MTVKTISKLTSKYIIIHMSKKKNRHSVGIDIPIKYKAIKMSMGVCYYLDFLNLMLDSGVPGVLNI